MRYLRWVGLVSSFLIGGLIVAPVQSEASGTLIQIQSGPNAVAGGSVTYNALVNIPLTGGTASNCPSTAYTRCFTLTPGTYANVTVANASGATAKLLIGDFSGAGNKLDVITLSGVKFSSPSTNTTVKVIYTHKLDDTPNSGGGSFSYAMRIGGYFQAGADGTSYNNFVKLTGSGNLGASSLSLSPDLTYTVGGTAQTTNPFSLQHNPTYPASSCSVPCTPTITQTMTIVLIGTDSLNLLNSVDGGGSDCNLGNANALGPGANPARPCHGGANSLESKITAFLTDKTQLDTGTFPPGGGQLNEACSEACTQDPDIINPGSITINKHLSYCGSTGCAQEIFNFLITGPIVTFATVTTNTNSNQDGLYTVEGLPPGTYYVQEIAREEWVLLGQNCAPDSAGVTVVSGGTGSCQFTNEYVNSD